MAHQGPPPGSYSPQMNNNISFTHSRANQPMMELTKGLAGEVRCLLGEIGKLREERRQLQAEIAELMMMKAKFGHGGEYQPNWHPPQPQAIEPPPMEMPPPLEEPLAPARPGWRTVHKKPERRVRTTPKALMPPPAAAAPVPEPVKQEAPAWAQWRPNPLLAPTPVAAQVAPATPPPRGGLFGPSTPPPK
ncbi:hypothetical protein BJ165DRAFT_1527954 [Panaeolus papilionaceus]|nr:hypothetical protein BJ165DRAFT_1527954 [Panaeolus papilionaceus]